MPQPEIIHQLRKQKAEVERITGARPACLLVDETVYRELQSDLDESNSLLGVETRKNATGPARRLFMQRIPIVVVPWLDGFCFLPHIYDLVPMFRFSSSLRREECRQGFNGDAHFWAQ